MFGFKIITQYEKGIVFRFGRALPGIREAGRRGYQMELRRSPGRPRGALLARLERENREERSIEAGPWPDGPEEYTGVSPEFPGPGGTCVAAYGAFGCDPLGGGDVFGDGGGDDELPFPIGDLLTCSCDSAPPPAALV